MTVQPNHQKLIIPGKNSVGAHFGYATDCRTIEQWANEGIVRKLIAGANITLTPSSGVDEGQGVEISARGGSGGYASLTGPGETTTPGALTQAGPFTVDGDFGVVDGSSAIAVTSTSAEMSSDNVAIFDSNGDTIEVTNAGAIAITSTTGQGMFANANQATISTGSVGQKLAFFDSTGTAGVIKQSGAGITTVAQVVTVLRAYGLLS